MRESRTSGLMSGEGKRSRRKPPPRPSSTLRAPRRRASPVEGGSTQTVVGLIWWLASGLAGQPAELKPCDKGRQGRLSDPAGRNASEARAGLESEVADADPPEIRGRPRGMGKREPTRAPVSIRRGKWARHAGTVRRVIWGGPWRTGVAAPAPAARTAVCWRASDRVMVPLRPGNAGGGTDPDFWRAFDDGEDR